MYAVSNDGIPETLAPKLDSMVADLRRLMAEIEEARARPDKRAPGQAMDEDEAPTAKKKAAEGPGGTPQATPPPGVDKPEKPAASAAPAGKAQGAEGTAATEDPEQVFKQLEQQAECRRRRREKAADTSTQAKAAPEGEAGNAAGAKPSL